MQVIQIHSLLNDIISEISGEQATLLTEDLSNVVDVGKAVFNATSFDNFTKKLVDRIGRVIFVDRKYNGVAPSVIYDGFEFGAVLEKIGSEIPEYTENETWDLVDGQSYDPFVFHSSAVYAKFFSKYVTFEVPLSVADKQAKSAFTSANELRRFVSMLFGKVEDAMTLAEENLVMRTINAGMAETIYADYGSDALGTKSGVKAINLLYKYNQKLGSGNEITAEQALSDPNFIRYASSEMMKTVNRLKKVSTLFNVGGKKRFTPKANLKIVLHGDFASDAKVYLYSSTFHDDYVKLPEADEVPYWQGTGDEYDPDETMFIDVKLSSDNTKEVKAGYIIGCMFDEDCLGVLNFERYTTSDYIGKAEFTNYWHKQKSANWLDLNENMVVYLVSDDTGE